MGRAGKGEGEETLSQIYLSRDGFSYTFAAIYFYIVGDDWRESARDSCAEK